MHDWSQRIIPLIVCFIEHIYYKCKSIFSISSDLNYILTLENLICNNYSSTRVITLHNHNGDFLYHYLNFMVLCPIISSVLYLDFVVISSIR
jgi:hypothetical protein